MATLKPYMYFFLKVLAKTDKVTLFYVLLLVRKTKISFLKFFDKLRQNHKKLRFFTPKNYKINQNQFTL